MSEPLSHRLHSSDPIARVDLLRSWERSRLIGAVIVNRLITNGTWQTLQLSDTAVIHAIAHVLGVLPVNGAGLVFEDIEGGKERERIAEASNLSVRSTYGPVQKLVEIGVMRCRWTTIIRKGQTERIIVPPFELLIPPGPLGELSNDEEIALFLGGGPSLTSDERAPGRAPSLYSDGLTDREPLTEPDLRAPGRAPSLYSDGFDSDKIVKSDSELAAQTARARSDGRSYAYASNASASAIALREAEKEGDCKRMLLALGFDQGSATNIARHSNCTPKQIQIAVARCDHTVSLGKLRTSRHAYIRTAIEKKYAPPPSEHERRLRELPEHEKDVVGPLIESERACASGVGGAGGAGRIAAPAVYTLAPVHNPKIEKLVSELNAAAPNAQRDEEAARAQAEKARRLLMAHGRRVEDAFEISRGKLATLGQEKLNALVAIAIEQAPNDFIRERFKKARSAPLEYKALIVAMTRILAGGDPDAQ